MRNESNREAREPRPSELQASDFFPPGHGWNKDDESTPRGPNAEVEDQDVMPADRPRTN